jgi:hypothetical protein
MPLPPVSLYPIFFRKTGQQFEIAAKGMCPSGGRKSASEFKFAPDKTGGAVLPSIFL